MTHRSVPAYARPVGDIMTTDVRTLAPDMRLNQAISLLAECPHAAMPVVEPDGRLVGILGENDLLRVLGRGAAAPGRRVVGVLRDEQLGSTFALRCAGATVGAVMTREVVTVSERASTEDAAHLIARHGIACLPVVAGVRLRGIVTREDLLRARAGGEAPGPGAPTESRERLLERQVQGEASDLRPGEWLVARVRGSTATLEGRVADEHRRLDLLRRIAAIGGIVRIEDRMEMALDGVW